MFQSIREFWQLARPFKGKLAVACALLSADALLAVFSVITVAPLADLVLRKPAEQWTPVTTRMQSVLESVGLPFDLVSVAVVFFLFALGMSVFSVFVRWILVKLRIDVVRYLIASSLGKMFSAGWGYFTVSNRGALFNTYFREVNNTGAAFQSISLGVASIVRVIAFISVPLLMEPALVAICMLVATVLILPFMYLGKWSLKFGKQNVTAANRYSSLVRESIQAAREVISFNREKQSIDQILKTYRQLGNSRIKAETFGAFSSQMYEPLGIMVVMAVLVVSFSIDETVAVSSVAVVLLSLIHI